MTTSVLTRWRNYSPATVIIAGSPVSTTNEHLHEALSAAPGEWRTNIALGGSRRPAEPSLDACALAVDAAAAVGGELVGVDLLPDERGPRVIEINGAVDFTDEYALDGRDVFARAVEPFLPFTAVDTFAPANTVMPLPVHAVSA